MTGEHRFCVRCGERNLRTDRSCAKCGAELIASSSRAGGASPHQATPASPKIVIAPAEVGSVAVVAPLAAAGDLPKASIAKRWGAAFLDEAVWVGAAILLGIPSGGIGGVLAMIYAACQDAVLGGGTSLGRKAVGQVLVDEYGQEVSYLKGIGRNSLRYVIWTVTCSLAVFVDVVLVLVHPKGQTLADFVLGTQVIDVEHVRSATPHTPHPHGAYVRS